MARGGQGLDAERAIIAPADIMPRAQGIDETQGVSQAGRHRGIGRQFPDLNDKAHGVAR